MSIQLAKSSREHFDSVAVKVLAVNLKELIGFS